MKRDNATTSRKILCSRTRPDIPKNFVLENNAIYVPKKSNTIKKIPEIITQVSSFF